MKTEPFTIQEIPRFLELAAAEGWIAEEWELKFLIETFPEGCRTIRDDAGKGIGYVNSIKHGVSGWIGNLIVAPEFRGKGVGEKLFLDSVKALQDVFVETIWLTASKMGMGLYARHGFKRIDTVARWCAVSKKPLNPSLPEISKINDAALALSLDALAWGDRRDILLDATMARGSSIYTNSGFITIQPCGESYQLGSFIALNHTTAEKLLRKGVESVSPNTTIYLDAPISNHNAIRLCNKEHFRITGKNELMYFGKKPAYRPEFLYGLATMGSCG